MKKLTTILFLLSTISSFAQNVTLNYKIISNRKTNAMHLSSQGKVYYDVKKSATTGTIKATILEPVKVVLVLNENMRKYYQLWLHDGVYNVEINDSTHTIKFINSMLNDAYYAEKHTRDSLRVFEEAFEEQLNAQNISVDEKTRLQAQTDSVENVVTNTGYDNLIKNPTTFLAIDFLRYHIGANDFNKQKLNNLFNKLPNEFKTFPTYTLCKEALAINKIYTVGDTLKDVNFKLSTGKYFNACKDANGKYTYIDFHTGCKFKIKFYEEMKSTRKTLNQQINFVSVSDETDYATWLRYIKQDKTKWLNTCDFKGDLSPYHIQFNVYEFPTGILVNKQGVIIKNNIKEIDLTTLKNLLE